ncbi:hypothetical protein EFM02_01625 [Fructilactobacillus fructivorans]|nr:hypothetical protein [Fructilactobacillus fructivorans]MCT2867390.1 hypothetical protein [Fructilactobacillus fructivorans]MCT2873189.1 hypothetical protein [Fructilactobacillus fructivorans]
MLNKLASYYRKSKDCNQNFYVYKCLNDLFGARIVLPGIEDISSNVFYALETLKSNGIISRYYLRNDGNYCGIHCYLQFDNRHLTWELQIWDKSNAQKNRAEHGRHEREKLQ